MDQTNRIILQGVDNTGPAFNSAKQGLASIGAQAEMSAKATAAAMRMVPAQITDIVTGLATGQKPITVLLQQGGQLKDMFGGVVPAAKALGATLLGLLTPTTLVAGAAGAVAVAFVQGAKESESLNKVLILTGNYAAFTAGALNDMAKSLSKTGSSRGEATDTLVQVIASGKVAHDQIYGVSQAALEMSKVTGQSVKEIVAQFVQLGEEPATASAKLNQQYHYLTESVYEQIKALEEHGRAQDAAALAQGKFAEAGIQRAKELRDNLGMLERAWNTVTLAAKKAWDAMLDVGRTETPEERLAKASASLTQAQQRLAAGGFASTEGGAAFGFARVGSGAKAQAQRQADKARADMLDALRSSEIGQGNARSAAENAAAQEAGIAARDRVKALQDNAKGMSAVNRELQKYQEDLERIRAVNPNSVLLDPKAIAAGEKAIRDAHIGSDGEHSIDARLKALSGKLAEEQRFTSMSLDQIKADYDVGLVSTREYLDKEYEARQAALERQIAIVRQQEELARGKKNIAAVEQYMNDEKRLQDEIEGNFIKHNDDLVKLTAKQRQVVDEYARGLGAEFRTRQEGIDNTLAGAGLSARQLEQQQRLLDARMEYDKRVEQLQRDRMKGEAHGGLSKEEYETELAIAKDYYGKRIAQEQDFNAKQDQQRSDWTLGAKKAFAEYADSARDAAGQSAKFFGDVMQSMEDALVEFVTTGKLNFRSFANSIIAEIARIQIKAAMAQIFAPGSSGGGLLMQLGSAIFGGSGGFQAAFSQTSLGSAGFGTGAAYGNMDIGAFLHSGGIAGSERSFSRAVNPAVFRGAPRYHTGGLAGDEVPAILRRGEGVFTPGQMKALSAGGAQAPDLKISIINQTSAPIGNVTERRISESERAIIIEEARQAVSADLFDANSRISRGLGSNYDARRKR